MEKEYRELFDGVRASGRLRMEVMNMKREETKRVRRIPRAALIAAALVLALAGTAVAAEFIYSSLHIQVNDEVGFCVTDMAPIQSREVPSDEFLEYADQIEKYPGRLGFDSWEEAEEFIGADLVRNSYLEQMEQVGTGWLNDSPDSVRNCILEISTHQRPWGIVLDASYQTMDFVVRQIASIRVGPGHEDSGRNMGWPEAAVRDTETYITPSGLETVIMTLDHQIAATEENGNRDCQLRTYMAYLNVNGVQIRLEVNAFVEDPGPGRVIPILKDILDSYE